MKCQTIIAGIGGQGVLFAAKVFTEMARHKKLQILGSQTFGMSQRGGSVMTHMKIGAFDSPLVCEGDADLLFALDCMEAHRNLPYLRSKRNGSGALCVVNAPNPQAFPDRRVADLLEEMGVVIHTCDAAAVALQMNHPMAANLVLLGFGSSREHFPFTYDDAREAIEALSGPAQRAVNLDALERGRWL
ncbi:MAG: 2-oxoacid:acceptor oxidoreductase family protein [Rhodocyclales bacterium]|nr:2-oxoacid:acceptor oxidoreductase family protein [Rhodocyclales bacterium]